MRVYDANHILKDVMLIMDLKVSKLVELLTMPIDCISMLFDKEQTDHQMEFTEERSLQVKD